MHRLSCTTAFPIPMTGSYPILRSFFPRLCAERLAVVDGPLSPVECIHDRRFPTRPRQDISAFTTAVDRTRGTLGAGFNFQLANKKEKSPLTRRNEAFSRGRVRSKDSSEMADESSLGCGLLACGTSYFGVILQVIFWQVTFHATMER